MTVSVWISLVAPDEMPFRATDWSGSIFADGHIAECVQRGRLVDGVDGDEKVLVIMLLLVPPSLTVTEMVAVPKALRTGVKVIEPVLLGLI